MQKFIFLGKRPTPIKTADGKSCVMITAISEEGLANVPMDTRGQLAKSPFLFGAVSVIATEKQAIIAEENGSFQAEETEQGLALRTNNYDEYVASRETPGVSVGKVGKGKK